MGWHYILTFKCNILPEYTEFIKERYFEKFFDDNDDVHYRSSPYFRYSSDDERGVEERERIAEWEREKQEELEAAERDYEKLSKNYKDLVDIWRNLRIGCHFYEYDFDEIDRVFFCKISKKVNWHEGFLREDYETFLKDIIVPISSLIIECEIESDDYGDCVWKYTDSELRNIHFHLKDKVKYIQHTYNEDRTEIIETRIVYKHSIQKHQFVDLDRCYK